MDVGAIVAPDGMQIDIGGVVIKLESNFDDDALVRVIRIVRGAL